MQKRRNIIRGLRWAKALDERPGFISSPRIKGIQRAGLIYENRIANYMKALYGKDVLHGQWYQFEDTVVFTCKIQKKTTNGNKKKDTYKWTRGAGSKKPTESVGYTKSCTDVMEEILALDQVGQRPV